MTTKKFKATQQGIVSALFALLFAWISVGFCAHPAPKSFPPQRLPKRRISACRSVDWSQSTWTDLANGNDGVEDRRRREHLLHLRDR